METTVDQATKTDRQIASRQPKTVKNTTTILTKLPKDTISQVEEAKKIAQTRAGLAEMVGNSENTTHNDSSTEHGENEKTFQFKGELLAVDEDGIIEWVQTNSRPLTKEQKQGIVSGFNSYLSNPLKRAEPSIDDLKPIFNLGNNFSLYDTGRITDVSSLLPSENKDFFLRTVEPMLILDYHRRELIEFDQIVRRNVHLDETSLGELLYEISCFKPDSPLQAAVNRLVAVIVRDNIDTIVSRITDKDHDFSSAMHALIANGKDDDLCIRLVQALAPIGSCEELTPQLKELIYKNNGWTIKLEEQTALFQIDHAARRIGREIDEWKSNSRPVEEQIRDSEEFFRRYTNRVFKDSDTQKYNYRLSGEYAYRDAHSLIELEKARPGITKFLKDKFGIMDFGRYPTKVLIDQYDQFEDDTKPYGLILYPRSDWNGSFHYNPSIVASLADQAAALGYRLKIAEVNSLIDATRILLMLKKKYPNHKISFAMVGGHGTKTSIEFGEDDGLGKLEMSHLSGDGIKRALGEEFFEEGAPIVLRSCSTFTMAQEMSKSSMGVTTGPDDDTGIESLELARNNDKVSFTANYHEATAKSYKTGALLEH
jgi:hypothetical protein